ncbi:Lrp/AsnC family transcriptional regulator, partial [Candidatus Micrarchaeota archaeon]|nr:Lrp/AsnC family transcriptional regulator [Candidatus Micrarchaeota archaeon]
MDTVNLDLIDRKILSELDNNARISYSTLGKQIRVAKETVKYRISSLEKIGVIKGYYTLVDFSKLGFVFYRTYIRLQNTPPEIEQKIAEYLSGSKNVAIFYQINGAYHIALGVWAKNLWKYEEFWLNFKNKFGQYFSNCHFSILTEYVEFSRSYLLANNTNEKTSFMTISKSDSENLDSMDFKLLSYLSNNARVSIVDIATALKTSIVTVRYRMKNLIDKKVITGFRTIFDLSKLGKEYYKV